MRCLHILAALIAVVVASNFLLSSDASLTYELLAPEFRTSTPRRIIVPLPQMGYDHTEVSIPWKLLTDIGHVVTFATPDGTPSGGADPHVLSQDCWGFLGRFMRHVPGSVDAYHEMIASTAYHNPIAIDKIISANYDALLIPGGHYPGVTSLLTDRYLQEVVAPAFFHKPHKVVGAICHGVLVLSRGRLLKGVRTTIVPVFMEAPAAFATKYLAGLAPEDYQLSTTFPHYTADELIAAKAIYERGPLDFIAVIAPGTPTRHAHTFLVEDGNYVSARFWGDAAAYGLRIAKKLEEL